MIDNTSLLEDCIEHNAIRLHAADILRQAPPRLPADFDFQKVEGMLLGLAVGDALGEPTEGMLPDERKSLVGEQRDYIPARRQELGSIGAGTDDTQLAFWTVEQLITDGGLIPERLMEKFSSAHIVGIGSAVRGSLRRHKSEGLPWQLCGVESMGNGALMRIAPTLLPYLQNPNASVYADAALNAMLTHNDRGNIASCVAFVLMLWELLRRRSMPEPEWWLHAYESIAGELEGDTTYEPSMERCGPYAGPLWKYTVDRCKAALSDTLTVIEACETWSSGAYLMETMPSVLYVLARHGHDPEAAIVRAVNDTKDNDTVAAIVGAAVGALHGLAGLPDRWVKGLSGLIRQNDQENVFRLLVHAKQVFWLRHQS
ncbi:ADP-ribosylglycohydrolase family protein [Chloroflexota bacterium]